MIGGQGTATESGKEQVHFCCWHGSCFAAHILCGIHNCLSSGPCFVVQTVWSMMQQLNKCFLCWNGFILGPFHEVSPKHD